MNIIDSRSSARFSPCRRWRYVLYREWDAGEGMMVGCGLNPSTADEKLNDPTISILIKLAQREGFRSFTMLNLFAWRATEPKDMKAQLSPIGCDNNFWIYEECSRASKVVACWGSHGKYLSRDLEVTGIITNLRKPIYCIGVNADGTPKHPLYSRSDVQLVEYMGRAA